MQDSSAPLPGTLDGYRLIRFLGRGGFGEVWLCRSEAMGDHRALKWIPATNADRLEKEYESLLHYRKAAAALRSPSLVLIEHVGRIDSGLYYIMPLADGATGELDPEDPAWRPMSLTEKIEQQATAPTWFSSSEVTGLITPVLEGLQVLSEAGLVHRDVKPDNILFFDGKPCLGDISLLGEDLATITRRGTPGYATPSWYLGGHPDMYGAAATLYSLLTGNPPDRMGKSSFLWPPGGESLLAASERSEWKRLHAVVRRAIEDKVSERYVDFRTMSAAVAGDSEAAATPSGRRRGKRTVAAFATLSLIAAAIGIALKERPADESVAAAPMEEATPKLPELTADEKADYQALAGMVVGYLQDGNYANSLASVEELLSTYPQSRSQPAYSVAKAMALEGLGRIDEAKEEMLREVNLSPNITAMSSRKDLWERMGDLEGAENDLTRVLDTFGHATFPLFLRADIRAQRKDFAGVQSDREAAYIAVEDEPEGRRLVDAMWTPLEKKYPGYGAFLGNETAQPEEKTPDMAAPSAEERETVEPSKEESSVGFTPPRVDRSPRDFRKANSLSEDSQLAINSLSWFLHEDGGLNPEDRDALKETLERVNLLIRNEDNEDFGAAAQLVGARIEATPALKTSPNARLAKLLFLYCDGDHDQSRIAESDPTLRRLGNDSLAYRVELMDRLKMDPLPLLNPIISSPDTDRALLVQALVERARHVIGYNDVEAARSDLDSARRLAQENPAMLRWVEAEGREITD